MKKAHVGSGPWLYNVMTLFSLASWPEFVKGMLIASIPRLCSEGKWVLLMVTLKGSAGAGSLELQLLSLFVAGQHLV